MRDTLVPVAGEVRRLTNSLLAELAGDATTNVVCSGLGLWSALGVLATGAESQTAREIESVLGVPCVEVPELLKVLDERVTSLGGATHAVAVWSRVPVYKAFRALLPMAGFGQLGDDTDLDAWTRERTHGMIERFPVRVDDRTLLALADAIALWTQWETPFDEEQTDDRPFYAGEYIVDAKTMHRRFSAHQVSFIGGATRFDLPCKPPVTDGDSPAFGGHTPLMRFAVGDPGTAAGELMMAVLSDATGGPAKADLVDVYLPKFSITNDVDLAEPLRRMGAPRMFTDAAGFGRISPEPLAVSEARQSAVIDVDEVGVKAAAVTAFAMRAGAAFNPNPTVMELRFDRPFAFALVDPELDLPLFAGWVADPRA